MSNPSTMTDRELAEELLRTQRATLQMQTSIMETLIDTRGFPGGDYREQKALVRRMREDFRL